MVHSFLAFSCCFLALFGAFFSSCGWDDLSWGGVRSGKSSGEEIGLRDGNENVLIMLGGDCLSRDFAQFGVGECDGMGVLQYELDLLVGEVLVVVMVVVNVVGVVGEGTLAEVVGEVVVEKEPGVVLVGGEVAFGDMRLKGLPMGPQCRMVLHTLFWQPLPRCLFFLGSLMFPCFHGLPCWVFSFSFCSMWVILGVLVSLLLSLLLLGSVVLFGLLELSLALLIVLLLLLLLVQGSWFVFEEGMQLDFFPPLFGGTPPLPGHLGPALLVTCFGLGLTRVLGRCCGGGAGCF